MCFNCIGQAGAIRHTLSNVMAAFSDDHYQRKVIITPLLFTHGVYLMTVFITPIVTLGLLNI